MAYIPKVQIKIPQFNFLRLTHYKVSLFLNKTCYIANNRLHINPRHSKLKKNEINSHIKERYIKNKKINKTEQIINIPVINNSFLNILLPFSIYPSIVSFVISIDLNSP